MNDVINQSCGDTAQLMTASSSLMSGHVDSVHLTLDSALSKVAVPPTVTGVSLLSAHKCGTPCQPN